MSPFDWSEHNRNVLTSMRRDLAFIANEQINNIPSLMAHVAKAVAEIEWILARIPKPPKPKTRKPVRLQVTSHTTDQLPPHQPFLLP